jgi:hypothetical protein
LSAPWRLRPPCFRRQSHPRSTCSLRSRRFARVRIASSHQTDAGNFRRVQGRIPHTVVRGLLSPVRDILTMPIPSNPVDVDPPALGILLHEGQQTNVTQIRLPIPSAPPRVGRNLRTKSARGDPMDFIHFGWRSERRSVCIRRASPARPRIESRRVTGRAVQSISNRPKLRSATRGPTRCRFCSFSNEA